MAWPPPPGDRPRGSLLFFPGRGDFYEKYLETLEHWRRQGWQVTAMDWRGQAFSGRLGADGITGHIDDFTQWTADLAAFWPEWAAVQPGPHVLAGHSMGGHLVLRATAEGKLVPPPDALVLSAPMLGTHPEWLPDWLQRLAARVMGMVGDPRRPAWKWSEKPGELPADRQGLLTHDDLRYADEVFWRNARPELAMGPGSWGWVQAAARSMQMLARPATLAKVTMPVLLLATAADRLVSVKASRRAARLLPYVTYWEMGEEAAHEILREADPVRDNALATIDAFLDKATPNTATPNAARLDIGRNGTHGRQND
jgi:lysophospholipase